MARYGKPIRVFLQFLGVFAIFWLICTATVLLECITFVPYIQFLLFMKAFLITTVFVLSGSSVDKIPTHLADFLVLYFGA